MRGQSRIAVLLRAGGHAEGGKHSHQRHLGDQHLPAGPVRIPRGDAESPGKFDQRGRELSHAAHLASGIRPSADTGHLLACCTKSGQSGPKWAPK